jgi:RNA methyltransferase, TrmH family
MPESGPETLSSPANPTIKRLVRLRDNRFRRRSKRLLVDGWRESARAISAGLELVGCYVPENQWPPDTSLLAPHDRADVETIRIAASAGKLVLVSEPLMERIGFGQSPRGIVTEFLEPDRRLDQLSLPSNPLVLVLDGIEKPGNVGAIFRCADAAGVDAVILSSCECDLHNPNAIRSSLGAVFSVPAASGSREEVQQFLMKAGVSVVAARVESAEPMWSLEMDGALAILVGSESHGLGEHWKSFASNAIEPSEGLAIRGVRIPMAGQVDSLNVSVSAALLVYEAVRKRTQNASNCR